VEVSIKDSIHISWTVRDRHWNKSKARGGTIKRQENMDQGGCQGYVSHINHTGGFSTGMPNNMCFGK